MLKKIARISRVLAVLFILLSEISPAFAVDGQQTQEAMTFYQTSYYPRDWLGDLKARPLDAVASGVEIGAVKWSAAEQLSQVEPGQRNIVSVYGEAVFTFRPGDIPEDLQKMLEEGRKKLSPEASAEDLIGYIRGEEKAGFRERKRSGTQEGTPEFSYKLGDFVHSSPVYHGGMVYVGGNAGMLHAFDADTGREVFAFVPSFVYPNLWELMDPLYSHRYYVDGPVTVRRIVEDGQFKDLLVGALRKGGKGYFGMTLREGRWDVGTTTVTEAALVSNLKPWEFPSPEDRWDVNLNPPGDRDMGESFSEAVVVQSNLRGHPWVAVFGNGYNSASGEAVLIVLDVFTGEEIRKIKTGIAGDNGLASPAIVDMNKDGQADWVYAGDLKGNMWKFDISSSDEDDWEVFFAEGTSPEPLFTGVGKPGEIQPITTKPGIARHCSGKGYMVVWGTGKYLEDSDLKNVDQQTFYGVWDYGDESRGILKRSDFIKVSGLWDNPAKHYGLEGSPYRLVRQETLLDSRTGGGFSAVEVTSHTSYPQNFIWNGEQLEAGSTVGWFFDLPDRGERIVQDTRIHGRYALGTSFVPDASASLIAPVGYSWLNVVDFCTGARASEVVLDVDGDDRLDEKKDNFVVGETVYPISRVRVEGMLYTSKTLSGKDQDTLLASTSHTQLPWKITLIKEEGGESIFYWRMR